MKISPENIELIEKIKNYRSDKHKLEIIAFKNDILAKQNQELKSALKQLKSDNIDRNKLLDDIKNLKEKNKKLKVDIKKSQEKYEFLITSPKSTGSVYGEIKNNLKNAKKEVLVCSPWITYLLDEFEGLKKDINIKVITTFRSEDIEHGITDIDKIRVLKKMGSEIRYNNNLHAKIIIIDSKVSIISSANMTSKGMRINYEAGVLVKDQNEIKKAIEFFNGVWKVSQPLNDDVISEYGE
jgi:phosphatidylserine/phosphatidylglycerophosphate/cardiolipin synthase-like enzyme